MGIEEDDDDDDEDLGEYAEVLMRGLNSYTGKAISKSPLERPAKKINRLLALDQSEDSDDVDDITILRHNTQHEGMTAIGTNFSMVDLENRINEQNDLINSKDRALNLQEKRNSNHRLANRRKLGGIYTVEEYTDGLKQRRSLLKHRKDQDMVSEKMGRRNKKTDSETTPKEMVNN